MLLSESRIVLTEKTGNKKDLLYTLEAIDALLSFANSVSKIKNVSRTHLNDKWLDDKWVIKILTENGYKINRAKDDYTMNTGYIERKLIK